VEGIMLQQDAQTKALLPFPEALRQKRGDEGVKYKVPVSPFSLSVISNPTKTRPTTSSSSNYEQEVQLEMATQSNSQDENVMLLPIRGTNRVFFMS
jgi:hypothetical protein